MPDHLLDTVGVMAQDVPLLLELGGAAQAGFAVHGLERLVQVLGCVPEVDDLLVAAAPARQERQVSPVVARTIGDGDHTQVGPTSQDGPQLVSEGRLERHLALLGHSADAHGPEEFAIAIVETQRRAAGLVVTGRPFREWG